MFKTTLITTAFVFALATAQAQPPTGTAPTFTEAKAYLTLSDTQLIALNNIQTAERTAAQSLMEQMQAKRQSLDSALSAGTTASAAGQLLLDIEAIRKQVAALNSTYQAQALAVLSDAQKTKLKALDEASKLNPQIHQAQALNLLTPDTEGGPGFGGPGFGRLGKPSGLRGPGGRGGPAPLNGPDGNRPFRHHGFPAAQVE